MKITMWVRERALDFVDWLGFSPQPEIDTSLYKTAPACGHADCPLRTSLHRHMP